MEKPYRNKWDAYPVKPRDESTKSYNEHLEDAHKRGQVDASTVKQYKNRTKASGARYHLPSLPGSRQGGTGPRASDY